MVQAVACLPAFNDVDRQDCANALAPIVCPPSPLKGGGVLAHLGSLPYPSLLGGGPQPPLGLMPHMHGARDALKNLRE